MTRNTSARFRWLNSASWLWLALCLTIGGYLIASGAASAPMSAGSANDLTLANSRPAAVPHATRNIEDIRVGMRVLGRNPENVAATLRLGAAWATQACLADPSTKSPNRNVTPQGDNHSERHVTTECDGYFVEWRRLALRMAKENGDELAIELLRPVEWLSFFEVAVGRTIDLDLSEMGAEGPAEVLAVEPCPPLPPGPGNVVTGAFAHRSTGDLVDLRLAGEPRPTGVTRNHRYWSADRQAFVAAGDLRLGERLLTATGATATLVAPGIKKSGGQVRDFQFWRRSPYPHSSSSRRQD